MSDTISRQAAIDYFVNGVSFPDEDGHPIEDSDELRKIWTKCFDGIPSAQPEIIHCRDCKHWTRTCGDEQWGLGDCDVFDKHLVMCNGYCAWAERREDERSN